MNDYIKQIIDNWKKRLFLLFLIPIILIGCIYISYGESIDTIIVQQNITLKLFELKTHLLIFQKSMTLTPFKNLPIIVSSIGYYSVIFLYLLFLSWLMLFAFSAYVRLKQKMGKEFVILLETVIITTVYIFSIIPGLNIWLSILGGLVIISVIVILFLYWNYNRLIRNEKK